MGARRACRRRIRGLRHWALVKGLFLVPYSKEYGFRLMGVSLAFPHYGNLTFPYYGNLNFPYYGDLKFPHYGNLNFPHDGNLNFP